MPALKGDINGKLIFGSSDKPAPNEVKVSIKDTNKSTVSEDGKFTFAGLEAGEYTIEAQTKFQSDIYKGEAKVKLVENADYQKIIEITLAK